MVEESEGGQRVSKYNAAVAQLMRLDELWKDAHKYSKAGNYFSWNIVLDKIWSELARDLNDIEKREKEILMFDKKLRDLAVTEYNSLVGFETMPQEDMQKKRLQYRILLEKEIWLGRLQNELGKGTSWQDDDDYMD